MYHLKIAFRVNRRYERGKRGLRDSILVTNQECFAVRERDTKMGAERRKDRQGDVASRAKIGHRAWQGATYEAFKWNNDEKFL